MPSRLSLLIFYKSRERSFEAARRARLKRSRRRGRWGGKGADLPTNELSRLELFSFLPHHPRTASALEQYSIMSPSIFLFGMGA